MTKTLDIDYSGCGWDSAVRKSADKMARIGADPHDNAAHYCLMPRIGTIFAAGCGDTAEWFYTRGEVARLAKAKFQFKYNIP